MASFLSRLTAGVKAFRETVLSSSYEQTDASWDFGAWENRVARYQVYWAAYENTLWRQTLHPWVAKFKSDYGMYKYVRSIYNPTYRLVEFWKTFLWGGPLDPMAGDGKLQPSAIPIQMKTESTAIREAIGRIWQDSNWQSKKDVVTLHGSCLGDFAIKIEDDTARGKVYLRPVHPSTIYDIVLDAYGNVRGYEIVERRRDPRDRPTLMVEPKKVWYREVCTRDEGSDIVRYQTFLDNELYAWDPDQGPEWEEPYGFVPMVVGQHHDVGLDWGWSELLAELPKIREVDDLASKTSDQIRKMVDSPWFISGASKPRGNLQTTGTNPTTELQTSGANADPEKGRQEIPMYYATNPAAKASAMVAPLDIVAAISHIAAIVQELEKDMPELSPRIWEATNSSRAIRVARQPVEAKVNQRRPNYDVKMVAALQMAMSLGGFRKYEGYEGFNLDSYRSGQLDFKIGQRPIFAVDVLDRLEEESSFWNTAEVANRAGVDVPTFVKLQNWPPERIEVIESSETYQLKKKAMKAALEAPAGGKPNNGDQGSPSSSSDSKQGSKPA